MQRKKSSRDFLLKPIDFAALLSVIPLDPQMQFSCVTCRHLSISALTSLIVFSLSLNLLQGNAACWFVIALCLR